MFFYSSKNERNNNIKKQAGKYNPTGNQNIIVALSYLIASQKVKVINKDTISPTTNNNLPNIILFSFSILLKFLAIFFNKKTSY